jgi:hypothetical protein
VEEDDVDGAAERPNKSVKLGVMENTYLTSLDAEVKRWKVRIELLMGIDVDKLSLCVVCSVGSVCVSRQRLTQPKLTHRSTSHAPDSEIDTDLIAGNNGNSIRNGTHNRERLFRLPPQSVFWFVLFLFTKPSRRFSGPMLRVKTERRW